MESRATTIAKNLALAMMFGAGVFGGSWVLSNSFLAVYFQWILWAGFYIVMYALVLALIAFMVLLAVAAVNALVMMLKAIFRRKKNDDEG